MNTTDSIIPNNSAVIVALTEAGLKLAHQLSDAMTHLNYATDVWFKPKPFADNVQQAFINGQTLIMICATGIVVRTLAPVLEHKLQDPPVLVLDEQGEFVIPLLSGHEGGANELARQVAAAIKGQLVMTTAKPYLQPKYAVGMGCERGCPQAHLQALLMTCLSQAGLTLDQISSINSIDIKVDEEGLIQLAQALQLPYYTYDVPTLARVEDRLSVKSEYVYNTVGVYGVAESAALIGAEVLVTEGQIKTEPLKIESELVLNKQKTARATCAVARAYPC